MAAVPQETTEAVTLEALIQRAVDTYGDRYQASRAHDGRTFDVLVFGDDLDLTNFVIERHDHKVVVNMPNRPLKRTFVTTISFKDLMQLIYHAKPRVTPRPPVDNGLKTLHELGRPFDWVDLHLTLGLVPAHAKSSLAGLIMQKKVRAVPTAFGGPARYEVIPENSPDLFPRICANDLRCYMRRFGTSARWIAAMMEAER